LNISSFGAARLAMLARLVVLPVSFVTAAVATTGVKCGAGSALARAGGFGVTNFSAPFMGVAELCLVSAMRTAGPGSDFGGLAGFSEGVAAGGTGSFTMFVLGAERSATGVAGCKRLQPRKPSAKAETIPTASQ